MGPEVKTLEEKLAEGGRQSLFKSSVVPFFLRTPTIPEGYQSAWAQYSILAANEKQREIILSVLSKEKIPTTIYYPKPLHQQEAFSFLGYNKGDFPESENIAQRIFSVPMHPYLKEEDQKKIVEVLQNVI